MVFILLYVDNTGVRSNCPTHLADVRKEGRIDLNSTGKLSWFIGVRVLNEMLLSTRHRTMAEHKTQNHLCLVFSHVSVYGSVSCAQQHYIEAMSKTWLLEGREAASVEEASKAIRLCKLPWLCIVELDAVPASEKPADPAFVARYQKLIGGLLYLSVNTMSEIGYVMSCLTRYMTRPTQKLKRVCHASRPLCLW